ncbi:MAG: 2'-5' RNA ligase family protein [Candidatus Berkiella sp.]
MMKSNIFLAALPSHDNRLVIAQKILNCETKRSPLAKIQWTHTQDLHLTLGFIQGVEEGDIRKIALDLMGVSQNAPFMANVEEIKIYGSAIVLRCQPYHRFLAMHKKMNQSLMEGSQGQYQFDVKKRYDAHLTIGRIRNANALNPLHMQQIIGLIQEQFKNVTFLIQQCALMRRVQENAPYQTIQLYRFIG